MKTKPICLAILALAVSLPLQAAATKPLGKLAVVNDDDHAHCSPVPDSARQRFLPMLYLDFDGTITLNHLPLSGGAFGALQKEGEFLLEGACNGGQCALGGAVLNCPASGGPTCSSSQVCYCHCETGGGSHNECR